MPKWLIATLSVLIICIGVGSVVFTWSQCGAKALILGNGGFAAAANGMCD